MDRLAGVTVARNVMNVPRSRRSLVLGRIPCSVAGVPAFVVRVLAVLRRGVQELSETRRAAQGPAPSNTDAG